MATTIHDGATWSDRTIGVSIARRGRVRTLSVSPPIAYALVVVGVLLAVWFVAATVYVVCYDDLFAAVLQREAATQEDYEVSMASVRTDLEHQTSRALVLESDLSSQIKALGERQAAFDRRAAVLDDLAAKAAGERPGQAGAHAVGEELRLRGGSCEERSDQRSALTPSTMRASLRSLTSRLAEAETEQVRRLAALSQPTAAASTRLRMALTLAGVPQKVMDGSASTDRHGRGQGGPFVPLAAADSGSPFWTTAVRLDGAAAELTHLQNVATHVPIRQPLPGTLEITSDFGPRVDPFLGRAAMHTGVDLRGDQGEAVRATAAGTVTIAEREGGYGNLVEIDHGDGYATRYAHLATIDVVPHQAIAVGQVVGTVGATGRATGPHLHYETRIAGEPVDPARFLKAAALLSAPDTHDRSTIAMR